MCAKGETLPQTHKKSRVNVYSAAKVSLQCAICLIRTDKLNLSKARQRFLSHLHSQSRVAREGFIMTDWKLWFSRVEESEEVNMIDTVMMDAMPSTNVLSNSSRRQAATPPPPSAPTSTH